MPDLARIFDSNKYMWDGEEYASEADARKKADEYKKDKFETHFLEEDGKHYVYSRRVVTEIVLEGDAPA